MFCTRISWRANLQSVVQKCLSVGNRCIADRPMSARKDSVNRARIQHSVKTWLRASAIAASVLMLHTNTCAQDMVVAPAVKISPYGTGAHWWVNLIADPNDGRRLLACGTRTEPGNNRMVGFVYLSTDFGRNWQQTLVDTSTSWVSEQSCAFGPNGRAYFLASASDVDQGPNSHSRGTTRVYRSKDGGASWKIANIGGFIDYSALTVDQTKGPHHGRLYVFGNRFYGAGKKPASMVLLSSSNDGATLSTPAILPEPDPDPTMARFPSAAVVLPDGTALAAYWHYLQKPADASTRGIMGHVEVASSQNGGRSLTSPVIVSQYESAEWDGWKNAYIGIPVLAVDGSEGSYRNRIYLAWSTFEAINLAFSDDGGRRWSTPVPIVHRGSIHSDVGAPQIAVNREGVLALAWAADQGACTFFAISRNGGQSLSRSVPISACRGYSTEANSSSMMSFLHGMPVSVTRTDRGLRFERGLGVSIRIRPGYAGLWQTSMVADAAGAFHPIWTELSTGGQLWTTTICVRECTTPPSPPLIDSLADLSRQVSIEVIGIDYNDLNSTVAMDITLRNNTNTVIRTPLFLKGVEISSDMSTVTSANPDYVISGSEPLWDLSLSIPEGGLRSGERTAPYRLTFRLTNATPTLYSYPVSARFAVYGTQTKDVKVRGISQLEATRRSARFLK